MSGRVQGWCPGALRPMASGDGLVVRVRPHAGRLTAEQALALADLSLAHGSGEIDLGARAHLQLRGVTAEALPALLDGLAGLGLLDADAGTEARRNILTTPVWEGAETPAIVAAIEAGLATLPSLPAKFGFAVDTGAEAVLGRASADVRIERAEGGGLILRAEGLARGAPVTVAEAADAALGLARWFAKQRGPAKRMAELVAAGILPPVRPEAPPRIGAALSPGRTGFGLCLALPFGRMRAETLRALAVAPVRLTPWRSVLLEGAYPAPPPGTISDPGDPLLRVAACTGRPGCISAEAETRALARVLAPLVPEGACLHVSGCAKGCAHPGAATVTLTARAGRFDLIPGGRPADPPRLTGLSPEAIPDLIRGHLAPPL